MSFTVTFLERCTKGCQTADSILVVAKVRKKGWFSSRKARDALVIHNSINVIMLRMKYSLGLLRDSSGASFFHNIRKGGKDSTVKAIKKEEILPELQATKKAGLSICCARVMCHPKKKPGII